MGVVRNNTRKGLGVVRNNVGKDWVWLGDSVHSGHIARYIMVFPGYLMAVILDMPG